MVKRGLQDGEQEMETKAPFGQRPPADQDVEMGEFEDPWEDEIEEEDEDVVEGEDVEEEEDEDEGQSCAN
jgi:ribosome assembly protein RRB1